jgi:hypothetical protein
MHFTNFLRNKCRYVIKDELRIQFEWKDAKIMKVILSKRSDSDSNYSGSNVAKSSGSGGPGMDTDPQHCGLIPKIVRKS